MDRQFAAALLADELAPYAAALADGRIAGHELTQSQAADLAARAAVLENALLRLTLYTEPRN